MSYYNPEIPPDPKTWLALDEGDRIRVVTNFHVASRIKMRDVQTHAALHTIVENQIASGFGPGRRAIARLQSEGLSRHDAIHAIGSVLVEYYHDLFEKQRAGELSDAQAQSNAQAQYNVALESLSAKEWKRKHGA